MILGESSLSENWADVGTKYFFLNYTVPEFILIFFVIILYITWYNSYLHSIFIHYIVEVI